jgi:hypothetical protein
MRSRPVWVFGAWRACEGLFGGSKTPPEHPPGSPQKHPQEDRESRVVGSGSNSTCRAPGTLGLIVRADVAQLVEHLHGKQEVPGSRPGVGLIEYRSSKRF